MILFLFGINPKKYTKYASKDILLNVKQVQLQIINTPSSLV